jgi:hypothetical protein
MWYAHTIGRRGGSHTINTEYTTIVRMTFSANGICPTNMSCPQVNPVATSRRSRIELAARPRSAANHPPPVCLACQVRTPRRGSPTGVVLLLLSPSASPERVWLYAAELDEHLLAPHILIIPSLARSSEYHQLCEKQPLSLIPGIPGHATKDAADHAGQCQTAWGPS